MLVKYNFKYSNGNLFNDDSNSAWTSPEGTKIRQQIDQLIEQFGLTRESPHRSPASLILDKVAKPSITERFSVFGFRFFAFAIFVAVAIA